MPSIEFPSASVIVFGDGECGCCVFLVKRSN